METLQGHKDKVYSVAFTPDGRGLVSGSSDKTLKYWDVSRLANALGGRPNSQSLGAKGNLPSGYIVSLLWVLKQFAWLIPSR